jgi:alpha-glucosidase
VPLDPGVWWRNGVVYQIYPRSFADTTGDGVGDLHGITAHLDHLQWLGVDGIWLNPVTVSPDADWGYDVSDYTAVQPALGTMADLDALLEEAARRDLRVLLDLVPNHTSIDHPWFVDARSSRDSAYRDWYVWADPKPDGSMPNNWLSSFGGPAWTLDERTGQYYLHNFTPEQPDLNWWNEEVRAEFDRILRFWFDRGVAGFRIDVCHMIVKDRELRDNPPAEPGDPFLVQTHGQRQVYNACRPEVHDVLRRWRAIADAYDPPRVFVGETFLPDVSLIAPFYGQDDQLHLAFDIPMLFAPLEARPLADLVRETEAELPAGAQPCYTGGNHDVDRFPTRWAHDDPDRTRCALLILLTLRGTPFLYYGDELGMPQTDVPRDRILDPVGLRFHPYAGRDGERTPMPWTGDRAAGAGFTAPGVEPWLPFGDVAACNVAAQRDDPGSVLAFTRDALALRRELADLRTGAYTELTVTDAVWAWRRGDRTVVAVNLSGEPSTVDLGGAEGAVRFGTRPTRCGERVAGDLALRAWEGVVVELDPTVSRRA